MCKWLRNILQPLNVLNKNIRCVSYPLSRTAHPINIPIKWTGDALYVRWTLINTNNPNKNIAAKFDDKNGNETTRVVHITPMGNNRANSDLFIKCVNVSSLIVNGETII